TGANEQFLIRVSGSEDAGRLCMAWQEVLRAHDALRTFIGTDDQGQPLQRICQTEEAAFASPQRLDFHALSTSAADSKLASHAAQCLQKPFDLGSAPLLRTTLVQLNNELVLLVTAHHIIADGMCVQLVCDELAEAWQQGRLARPELQYADFAFWQRQQDEVSFSGELAWWQSQLAGHSGEPVSAVTNPSAAGLEARFAFEIPTALVNDLRTLAVKHQATPFMVLLAAWRVWLSRCLMEQDLLIGSPVTLRSDESTARMMGCMVNNLVFRSRLESDADFTDVLAAEREQVLNSLAHSQVPFEKVVEAVAPSREYGRHPLFQLMFLFEDRTASPSAADGAKFSTDVLPVDRASYWDLELSVTDRGADKSMQAFIGVRQDIYDAEALSWWPEAFVAMLGAIARAPDESIAELPLLSPAQRHRVLVEWNDTHFDIDADATLHGLVLEQAKRTPSRTAIRDENEDLSYAELAERAQAYAAAITDRADVTGKLVGLNVGRSADTVAIQLGILMAGAAWLPLDPGYPRERLNMMMDDADPVLIITDNESSKVADNRFSVQDLHAAADSVGKDFKGKSNNVAYCLYTSGSTGVPKGIVATHASAVSRCQWMWQAYGFVPEDVFAQRTSLNFVDSIWEIFGPLAHGASVDVLPETLESDAGAMANWIRDRSITHFVVVPALLRALLQIFSERGCPEQLHTVITSGESLSTALTDEFFSALAGVRLLNTYGTSETWDVSCYEVQSEDVNADRVPIGRPVANASICILDEDLQPVPPGVSGELYAGGSGLAVEYLGQPELTHSQFLPNHLRELSTARLYRTGDLASYKADGTVQLIGRLDRQVKLRGLRIETFEIESLILKRDDIAQCAVVLQTEAEADAWLTLYAVPKFEADVSELRSYLQERLPRAMIPAEIRLMENLPLTPSGKLDVRALPKGEPGVISENEFIAPQSDLERTIALIWSDALGVAKVGLHDDFFALRGHSLLATRVIARIGEATGIEVPLQSLFEAPTVAGMARSVEALRWAATKGESVDEFAGKREIVRL
ncbi:MAG: non-ribosomal peptide synthetase, partial [Gammaproteobacteria bacterium]